ncbi:MAG: alpha/beta hydrolase [Chloroflexi bacterium]|nr:alpha/beta hydrolase [Chloroflexota bacterium]
MLTQAIEFDVQAASGRLHAQRFGSPAAPLVVCVPGLTANMRSFDFLGERLASAQLQLIALDLRGRGQSDVTPPGSYGWASHARDAFQVAHALGVQRFSLIGHSMGGAVAMAAARLDAERGSPRQHAERPPLGLDSDSGGARLERLVLIDICGVPESSTEPLISAAVARLGSVYPSVEDYLALVKQIGTVQPWSDYFERYLRYELEAVPGGVRARSSRAAALEDAAQFETEDIYGLWPFMVQPVLLLRAARELLPGAGYIVSAADRDRFAREVPRARVEEIDANHYGVITAESTAAAIASFFAA